MSGFPDLSDTRRGQVSPVTQTGLGHRRPGPGSCCLATGCGHLIRAREAVSGARGQSVVMVGQGPRSHRGLVSVTRRPGPGITRVTVTTGGGGAPGESE